MMNLRRAFNRHTTSSKPTIEIYVEGHYDDRNMWVDDSWKPPVKLMCTPIPFGDREDGVSGQQLKATPVGERLPAYIQIHSRQPMPMKSYINCYGIRYKVIQVGEYDYAGFHKVIATKELEK
ncbi:MAG: hypothetical protein EKE20_14705 [Candidatus Symbiopectobacterium sp. Dall1.0]|nr:hypothetical protein [Candidatus Symbiopectobacterium sp. Dall1.0]